MSDYHCRKMPRHMFNAANCRPIKQHFPRADPAKLQHFLPNAAQSYLRRRKTRLILKLESPLSEAFQSFLQRSIPLSAER